MPVPTDPPVPDPPARFVISGRIGHPGEVAQWVFSIVDRLGEIGVGLLIFLENLIPPVPSEVILPLAGFRASTGALNVWLVWPAATLGSVLGALVLYGLGAWLGSARLRGLAGWRASGGSSSRARRTSTAASGSSAGTAARWCCSAGACR